MVSIFQMNIRELVTWNYLQIALDGDGATAKGKRFQQVQDEAIRLAFRCGSVDRNRDKVALQWLFS